ncbi:response regulator [Deinococcus ficus]|uniref:Response regulator n=1 Tax=Deinococcus ficus TaxID=317577 RepID=A0A221T3F1_9DEIO|nr:response regulator [Deinococcus ficus]ASN83386.1 response regulator [Deinococcus ficus]
MAALRLSFVDDNEADHVLLEEALDELGLSADGRHFLDADAFLGALRRGEVTPDAVITDLNMPGRDGFDLILAVRACPAWGTLPVLVFTTSGAEEDRVRAAAVGADGYFVKPNSTGALVGVLKAMIQVLER